jgi:hypothetical protein
MTAVMLDPRFSRDPLRAALIVVSERLQAAEQAESKPK